MLFFVQFCLLIISDENWPPWVTAKPEDNDIVMVDEQPNISDATRQTIKTPSFINAASSPKLCGSIHLLKSLLIAMVVRFLLL